MASDWICSRTFYHSLGYKKDYLIYPSLQPLPFYLDEHIFYDLSDDHAVSEKDKEINPIAVYSEAFPQRGVRGSPRGD